jgi:hypothetical protein
MFQTSVVEKIKEHVFLNLSFENRAVYEIIWKNSVEPGRPQMTVWRMRIACWIPKPTNTNSDCVILIAFPLQQWLHERASKLRSTHISCLVASSQQRMHHTEDGLATIAERHTFLLLSAKYFVQQCSYLKGSCGAKPLTILAQ